MIESGYESDQSCRGRDWVSIKLTDYESVMAAGSEQCHRMSNALTPGLSRTSSVVAGDPVPANCELIEVHVSELKQLFKRSILHRSANVTSIHTQRNSSPIGPRRRPRRLRSGSPSTWIGRPGCRMNRRTSGKPSTNSSVTARNFRDVGSASSFAVAGRASS